MKLIMIDDNGDAMTLGEREGDATTARMLTIFENAILLQRRKASTYGDAFRSQGYMGNVARVLSKAARLKNMMWRDFGIDDAEESVDDTVVDLINLCCFFLINRTDRNKWGKDL